MDIDSKYKREQKPKDERGFSLIQILVTVSVIAVVSTFGVMAIGSARASLRLSGSARELAGYLEKARSNAIRRNDTADPAVVTIVDANSYTVRMDFDGNGTMETRTFTLPSGVTFDNGSIGVSAVFDWRGRVPNQLGIVLNNDRGASSSINLSGAGDVTLDNEIFQDSAIGDIPLTDVSAMVAPTPPGGSPTATPYPSPTATPTPTPTPTPIPTPTLTPTPDPLATPTPLPSPTQIPTPDPLATPVPTPVPTPDPTPIPTPIPCSISAPSSLTFAKNGSPKTFSITVSNGIATVITATPAGDINTVSPTSTTVTGSGTIVYTVTYPNGNSSGGTITISSPCGNSSSIPVTIN